MARLKALPSRLDRPPSRLQMPPKVADPFYLSKEWSTFAKAMKLQRGNVCEDCGAGGRRVRLIADHIVERKDGGADFDPLNIRIRCQPCHNRKTAKARGTRAGGHR